MAIITVCSPPSACVYIYGGDDVVSGYSTVNSLRRVAHNHSHPTFLRAQRVWESRPPKSLSAELNLHGCVGDQVFGERTRDCSLRPLGQR
jgi:hypothetical protein